MVRDNLVRKTLNSGLSPLSITRGTPVRRGPSEPSLLLRAHSSRQHSRFVYRRGPPTTTSNAGGNIWNAPPRGGFGAGVPGGPASVSPFALASQQESASQVRTPRTILEPLIILICIPGYTPPRWLSTLLRSLLYILPDHRKNTTPRKHVQYS